MNIWQYVRAGTVALIGFGVQVVWTGWATAADVRGEETSVELSFSEKFVAVDGGSSTVTAAIAAISVDELSDVLPSDWAYGALQRLAEQYGCVAGYPDGTFRGDRTTITSAPMTASIHSAGKPNLSIRNHFQSSTSKLLADRLLIGKLRKS